jgi:hypothetical protein
MLTPSHRRGQGASSAAVGRWTTNTSTSEALAAAPCDGCRLAARCAERREACASFAMYYHGEPEKRWREAPRAPSTARFMALFESS